MTMILSWLLMMTGSLLHPCLILLPLSYGIGAGVNIQIFNGSLGMHNNKSTVISMHVGGRYLFGTEANYLTQESILVETDGIRFEQVESDTDMIIPELGIRIGQNSH